MHVVEAYPPPGVPFRGTVVCVHGYPDSWYGWRKQIRPIAELGFHVVVPDQRGYGDTSAPIQTAEYTMQKLCADNIALLDALGVEQAVFLGHDFGGKLVWDLCLHHVDRCCAVGSVCTPFFPNKPDRNPWLNMMQDKGSRFDYQVWYNRAEAELEFERNVERYIKLSIRSMQASDRVSPVDKDLARKPPTIKGGVFAGLPEDPPKSHMLTDAELAYYVRQFKTSGARGAMNWYRNVERTWEWNKAVAGRKVTQPALMVTAGGDPILTAESARRIMPPHFHQLTLENVEDAGHWVLQEKPEEVNPLILKWLSSLPPVTGNSNGYSKL